MRETRLGANALRLQRRNLPLGQVEDFHGKLSRSLLLMQLRCVLLRILNAAKPIFRQGLIARRLLLCEHERPLRLMQLCLVGADLSLLDSGLRVDVLNARLSLLHRGLSLTDRDRVVRRIDGYQEIAFVNVFVVGDGQIDDVPRDFRRHGDDIGPHSGVARPRRSHICAPCRGPEHRRKGQCPQGDQE